MGAHEAIRTKDSSEVLGARTGEQFLAGLKARPRDLWLGNEKIDDVTTHPALAGGARAMAGLFDLQHQFADDCLMPDPETGELINVSHIIPRSKEDLIKRGKCLTRIHSHTVGHMGRSPDFVSICLAGFAGHARVWAGKDGQNEEGAHNLVEYQKYLRRNDVSCTHALVHPTIDKSKEPKIFGTEHGLRKVGETKDSIIVRGARILATLAPYADELLVWSGQPMFEPEATDYALAFAVPVDAPGLTFLCRDSTVQPGVGAFDQPLASRFDEQDAFVMFDNVEIPKSRVFNNGHVDIYNDILYTGFFPNVQQQTTIRALAKLEFAYGLGCQMTELLNDTSEGTLDMLGEILCYIEFTRSALQNAEHHAMDYGDGLFLLHNMPLQPIRAMMPTWLPRCAEILQLIGSHNLIAVPSRHMLDNPRLRPMIDTYIDAANGQGAERRSSVFRLAWDFAVSGLAGRQELYERFYIASGRTNRKFLHMSQNPKGFPPNVFGPNQYTQCTTGETIRSRADNLVNGLLDRSKD